MTHEWLQLYSSAFSSTSSASFACFYCCTNTWQIAGQTDAASAVMPVIWQFLELNCTGNSLTHTNTRARRLNPVQLPAAPFQQRKVRVRVIRQRRILSELATGVRQTNADCYETKDGEDSSILCYQSSCSRTIVDCFDMHAVKLSTHCK